MVSNTSNNQKAQNSEFSSQSSYEGKTVYVGIDVHKKTYSVVAIIEGVVVKKWRTLASPTNFAQQLLRYYPLADIYTVYEAGFSGFVLHRTLIDAGIDNIIVNPASIETEAHNRVKTDKRDAHKLATLLSVGRLRGITIPTFDNEQQRLLTRTRQQLVSSQTCVKNQIRMKCHQMGLIDPHDSRKMSHKLLDELLSKSPSSEFTFVIQALNEVWKTLETQIKILEQQLKQLAKKSATEPIYRSAPGIGAIAAMVLSHELGNLSQFRNERQLFSYTGLTPSEYSSGDKIRRGQITRQGNYRVRHILTQAAWRAIKEDASLKDFFERLFPRTGKTKAIIAVARKLIGRIRAAFRQSTQYQIMPIITRV